MAKLIEDCDVVHVFSHRVYGGFKSRGTCIECSGM